MTKDLKLKQVCPHFIVGEWLSVEDDRRTINPVRYPSNSQVRIQRNQIDIPRTGLYGKIRLATRKGQPFDIQSGVNDQIRFTLNGGSLITVSLPTGRRVNANLIAESFNEQVVGVVATAESGLIKFETVDGGPTTTLFLRDGTAHATLGLPATRFYRGRQISPGWGLVRLPNTFDERATQIVFTEQINAADDVFEVSYFTRRQDCRRCSGLGIENDIRHDTFGDPEFVTGIDLLAQEVEKITFTIQGSNIFYSWYGTSILELVGSKITQGGRLIETQLISEIGATLERFRNVKAQQARLQPVGDQEYLLRVKNLSVVQDERDPTIFRIRIEIQNRSGEVDQLSQTLAINTTPEGFEFVG